MPIHHSWNSLFSALVKQYGKEKGRQVFYAYLNKHGYDEEKPRKGQTSKVSKKEFSLAEPIQVVDKQFYGANIPIINVEVKGVKGAENYYFEAFLTAPKRDIHGESISEGCMAEWVKECVAPPHNLGWLWHESPYKNPDNKDKPAMYRMVEAKIDNLTDALGKTHRGLWFKAMFNKAHPRFREIFPQVQQGFINSVSAEFLPLQEENKNLIKAKYLASCLVMAPAQDLATITAVYTKNFMGAKIKMSINQPPVKPTQPTAVIPVPQPALPVIPDMGPDELEQMLRVADQNKARLMGQPVPGVPPVPAVVPVTVPPTPAVPPVTPVVPPSTVPSQPPTVQPNPLEAKVDLMLRKFEEMENRMNTIAPREPDPTAEEIQRIVKYLAEKPDLYTPKPPPVDPPVTVKNTSIRSKSVGGSSSVFQTGLTGGLYAWDQVKELLDKATEEALQLQNVVRKGVTENVTDLNVGDSNLAEIQQVDPHSLEALLSTHDKQFRNIPIGY